MSPPLYEGINPTTYLDLAETLSAGPADAAKRTAADRAYYAAFLASRDILTSKGYITPFNNSDDHQYIGEALKRKDVLGSFGNQENRLRRARNLVTYNTGNIINTDEDARALQWFLQTAKQIIDRVEALPDNPAKTS